MSAARPVPCRSPSRRWGFAVLTLAVVLVAVELIARLGLLLVDARQIPQRQQQLAEHGIDDHEFGEILHPYFGFCHDPHSAPALEVDGRHVSVNGLGFWGSVEPVQQRSSERLVVGVCGGSFAWQLCLHAGPFLQQMLRSQPQFADREIVLVNLALPGFKQPQQVMVLNYVLALGGEFDVVLNLDGFNELALSMENVQGRVNSTYPKGWVTRVHDVPDNRQLTESYRVFALRAERQRLARSARDSVFRRTALRQVWWLIQDQTLERRLYATVEGLLEHAEQRGYAFAAVGPREPPATDQQVYARGAELWDRCSRQMRAVAADSGACYVHALQPNQYLPGSKTLSPQEEASAYYADSTYREAVAQGYPLLRELGSRAASAGEHFVDLTQVFADQPQTLYVDWCCHVNREGYEIVARRLAASIAQAWSEESLPDPP